MGATSRNSSSHIAVIAIASVLVAIVAFGGALSELVGRWSGQEEYGHGFLIPVIVGWLLWSRRDAILSALGQPSWMGPVVIVVSILVHVIGELSAIYLLSHLAFVLTLIGIALTIGGLPLLKLTIVPLCVLLFAIPLPYFIESLLTWRLQIISSQLGVAFIRAFGIPVFLEGNIIDLGNYKLQVVEACSGLRYLYPLLCLSFLAAYTFSAPLWQRTVIFLSAIPITIVMNSVRIGIVGLLVNSFGTQMAEGAIHFFEGWVVFLLCAALLLGEIYLFARLSGRDLMATFGQPPLFSAMEASTPQQSSRAPLLACLGLLILTAVGVPLVSGRQELVPDRARFAAFPDHFGTWKGRASLMEPQVEHALGLEDYLLADYQSSNGPPVNVYVAYYASQRKGVSPHSPLVCMPGGGWNIVAFERSTLSTGPINRALIEKGGSKQLVYYWFVQRGRTVANEFWSKWYLFADAIIKNRTDGALVRVTTPIYRGEADNAADARLQAFVAELQPRLQTFLPEGTADKPSPVAFRY